MSIMGDVIRLGGDIAFTDHINSTIDNKIIERQIMEEEITEEVTKRVTESVTEEVTAQVTEEVTERVTEEAIKKAKKEHAQMLQSLLNNGVKPETLAKSLNISIEELKNIIKVTN